MFETIYRFLSIFMFSSNLAEHLSGWDETIGDYSKANIFSIVGVFTLFLVLLICFIYYYIVDHPRQNRWKKWLFFWLIPTAIISFLIAFGKSFYDMRSGKISSDITDVSFWDCIGFGFTNLIFSALLFFIISFFIKWRSINCKYSPFKNF